MSFKQRLLTLRLLPLTYNREHRDLVFLFNCIFEYTDLTIGRYVTFIASGRFRSKNPTHVLKLAYCKTVTFQSWNIICNLAPHDMFSSLSTFKTFLRSTYFTILDTTYNIDMPYTWFLSHNCPCHCSFTLLCSISYQLLRLKKASLILACGFPEFVPCERLYSGNSTFL